MGQRFLEASHFIFRASTGPGAGYPHPGPIYLVAATNSHGGAEAHWAEDPRFPEFTGLLIPRCRCLHH